MKRFVPLFLFLFVLFLAAGPAYCIQASQAQAGHSHHSALWLLTGLFGAVGAMYSGRGPVQSGSTATVSASAPPPDINPVLGGVVDRKKWYWYDTLVLQPGTQVAQQYSMFATGIGQQDPYSASGTAIKTKLQTNINPPGNQFSSPYDMILTNLMFKFAEWVRWYDIELFLNYAYLEFKILDKIFFEGHLWRHPAGAGVTGYTTQTGESVWNNGSADPGAIYYFGNWSKYIPPLTRFTLTINFPQTLTQLFNAGTTPAVINNAGTSTSNYPTLLSQGQGGNGMWLVVGMNGLSDGPVQ
jgi:hypothetical protein